MQPKEEFVVSELDVSRSLAVQAHLDWFDLAAKVISPEVINQIRAEDARRFKVISVGFGESGLIVAASDPLDIDTIDSLSFLLQREGKSKRGQSLILTTIPAFR